MRLVFEGPGEGRYPNGTWIAMTDDERVSYTGVDPLSAVVQLADALENRIYELEETGQ